METINERRKDTETYYKIMHRCLYNLFTRVREELKNTPHIDHRNRGGLDFCWDVNFEGADLRNADLMYVEFECTNLPKADLRNALMNGINLQNANLQNANLEGACLAYADLKNADLRNTNLRNVILREADLTGAIFEAPNGDKYVVGKGKVE